MNFFPSSPAERSLFIPPTLDLKRTEGGRDRGSHWDALDEERERSQQSKDQTKKLLDTRSDYDELNEIDDHESAKARYSILKD
jgi:hypothetical protein